MSKEKFLAIIDTELYFKDNEFWSKLDESTRKNPAPYLVISMLENGKIQFYDVYEIEFKKNTEVIAFKGILDENVFYIPFKDVPNRIDYDFLTSDSVFFRNSSLTFTEVYLNALRTYLQDSEEAVRDTWTQHILNHSDFIIALLSFYTIRKFISLVKVGEAGKIVIPDKTDVRVRNLEDFITPIMKILTDEVCYSDGIVDYGIWTSMDRFSLVDSRCPLYFYGYTNKEKFPTLFVDLRNTLFVVFWHQKEGKNEKAYLITNSKFKDLVEKRENAYKCARKWDPTVITDEIYEREMNYLESIKKYVIDK